MQGEQVAPKTSPLQQLSLPMLEAIEKELQQIVELTNGLRLSEMATMLAYHLGWVGEGAGREARGKRIRPLLVLLTTAAAGGEWKNALPSAAAVELIHNFSLIHDDIEDNSLLRRGRPTVWSKWGLAQGINAGDAMFTLAQLALLRLDTTVSPEVALRSSRLLQKTCLRLTQGQYLDISYESQAEITLDDYWPMIEGKTAALISACTELGALAASVESSVRNAYRQFGLNLGLAFQAQDDLLGIWGDSQVIGKSIQSDLLTGKKSLPILFGLSKKGGFAGRWSQKPITMEDVKSLAEQLKEEGAYDYTQDAARRLTGMALASLDAAQPQGDAGQALRELANQLLYRFL